MQLWQCETAQSTCNLHKHNNKVGKRELTAVSTHVEHIYYTSLKTSSCSNSSLALSYIRFIVKLEADSFTLKDDGTVRKQENVVITPTQKWLLVHHTLKAWKMQLKQSRHSYLNEVVTTAKQPWIAVHLGQVETLTAKPQNWKKGWKILILGGRVTVLVHITPHSTPVNNEESLILPVLFSVHIQAICLSSNNVSFLHWLNNKWKHNGKEKLHQRNNNHCLFNCDTDVIKSVKGE